MRKVDLRMNELIKYEIIKRVALKEISIHRASVKLNISIRQVYNLIKIYKTKGKSGFIHGNRGSKPVTTIPDELKQKIINLYQEKYFPANFAHFKDLLENIGINISYCTLYNTLTKAGFISPKCNRVTLKNKNKELKRKLKNKEKLTPPEKDLIATTNLQDPSISHPRKPRAKYFGELVQMDASMHLWFGDTKTFLHLAIDDATGRIIGAYFDHQETLNGYYHVLYQILTTEGIPAKFLTDNRTIFEYNKLKRPSDEKDTFTQFGYACHQLGIELTTTSIPQAKGRVERVFGTLQSRLITELRLAGIYTIQEANKYLLTFIKDYNKRFSVPIHYTKSVFDTQINSEKINYTLAVICERKIDNGNAIKYKNKYYQIYNEDKLMCFKPKTKCFVLEAFDGVLLASVGEEIYFLKILEQNKTYSKNFDIGEEKKPKYKGHKPKDCHPWTYKSFKKRQYRRMYA